MVALMAAGGNLADVEAIRKAYLQEKRKYNRNRRRNRDSTCQDSGSKSTGTCSYGRKRGVDYDSLDGEPAKLIS